ncbi:MAG: response regulator transcription factor [Parvibaculaceae bacterium]|nr:response regulator transcription factor [Parvibaculaceae bacterium]
MRILVVGEQPVFCEGLVRIASLFDESAQAVTLAGPAVAYDKPIEKADLVLIEQWETMNEVRSEFIRKLSASVQGRAAVFSGHESPANIREIMELGVGGFIPKSLPVNLVVSALRLIHMGGRYVPDSLLLSKPEGLAEENFSWGGHERLTPRQREVLIQLGKGQSNQEIAKALGISVATVKLHVNAILQTLGVRNRTEAAIMALRNEPVAIQHG